jgi:hypothetical protein
MIAASELPANTVAMARPCRGAGNSPPTVGATIDQNAACTSAHPILATTSSAYLGASAEPTRARDSGQQQRRHHPPSRGIA